MKRHTALFLALASLLSCALLSCLTLTGCRRAQQPEPAPQAAAPLPIPPMQGKPWTPPETKLPPVVVSAIKELFDQGMADPRGCEYREVEIAAGEEYARNQKVHAWVLAGDGKIRYAVAWNGRVVPVMNVGGAVNLRKDFKADTHGLGPFNPFRLRWDDRDWVSISEKSALPIKAALLLWLGEGELAEGVMKEGPWNPANDPYPEMAREWLGSWFHRGAAAFSNGDDPLALQIFRTVAPLQKKVEETATARGCPEPADGKPWLNDMQDLLLLSADEERRAKEPPHKPVLESGTPASGPERIAALVRDLELVKGMQWSNKSDTDVSSDEVVQALIREGDVAVGPLINCLENDQRLTRTQFEPAGLFVAEQQPWISVYEPAYIALTAILKFSPDIRIPEDKRHNLSMEDRKALAAKFREFWTAHKGMTPPERWFARLNDDNDGPGGWLQAAGDITQRLNQFSIPGSIFGGGSGVYATDKPQPMRGESLRAKSNPSVGDLLVKRFNELLPGSTLDVPQAKNVTLGSMGALICALAEWDAKGRVNDLRKMTAQLNEKFGIDSTVDINASVYQKRLEQGDPAALAEYADWVSSLRPGRGYRQQAFKTMWEHPDSPVIRKAADKLFAGENAPWQPIPAQQGGSGFPGLIETPMLGFAAYRGQLLGVLDDTTVIGYARPFGNGDGSIYFKDGDREDPSQSSLPKVNFRFCDYYASKLAGVMNFPDCKLSWPQEKRDAAVAGCKALLAQYGDNFKFSGNGDNPRLTFPKPGHPATAEDVAQGRAIFSLTGYVRLWPLPVFPLPADRPSSKQDPQDALQDDGKGPMKHVTIYTTAGTVWQAEEVLVDGKWQRFYGFSGRHQLEKVPAAEINFPSNYPYVKVAPGFDCKLETAQLKRVGSATGSYSISTPDTPLPIVIKLRNSSGLDQLAPGAFLLPDNTASTILPAAISLTLSYSEKIPPEVTNPPADDSESSVFNTGPRFDYGEWRELPLHKEMRTAPARTSGPLLNAANELTLLQMDLRNCFDITRPGSYRLVAIFQAPGEPAAKSQEVIFSVVEKD